jgi:hypothetical protein
MKILSWNCRGFAQAPTVRTLRALCRLHSPDIIFICESKSPLFPYQNPFSRMDFPLLFQVPASGSKGGLVVACKFGIDAEPVIQNNHQNSILIYSNPVSTPCMVTFAHAPSIWHDRNSFWLDIECTGNRFRGPWLLIGDLNAILSSVEKSGGRQSLGSTSHNNFLDFVQSNGLIDLGYSGNPFTWNNKRQGRENLRERLDRGLSNKDWVLLFPNSHISHLPASSSNHNPILLSTSGNSLHLPKPFKFEEFWIRDLSSHTVTAGAWQVNPNGSAAFSLCRKFKATKAALKLWNTLHFGNIQKNIKHLLEQINSIQCAAPDPCSSAIEENLHLNLQEELLREESLWKQKSQELWLTSNDLNTKFFHASTAIRRRYNSISSIKMENGLFLNNMNDIGLYFFRILPESVYFLKSLF